MGIDPGTKTGVAVWCRQQKQLIFVECMDFWGSLDRVEQHMSPVDTLVAVEVPKRGLVYDRHRLPKTGAVAKIAFNAGETYARAALTVSRLRSLGFHVEEVVPMRVRKWSAQDLKRYTGYDGRTNEHTRDAIRLCYQR